MIDALMKDGRDRLQCARRCRLFSASLRLLGRDSGLSHKITRESLPAESWHSSVTALGYALPAQPALLLVSPPTISGQPPHIRRGLLDQSSGC